MGKGDELESCLSPLGLLSQNTIDWVVYEQLKFISHSSGGWKSKIKAPAWSREGPLLG